MFEYQLKTKSMCYKKVKIKEEKHLQNKKLKKKFSYVGTALK